MTTNSEFPRATLFGAALLSIVGCGGASQTTPSGSLDANLIGDIPADMRSDYEVFASNCSKCHGLERALASPVMDYHHWDVYVAKMMRTAGSGINAAEAPHILRFLYWYTDQKKAAAAGGDTQAQSVEEAPPPAPTPSGAAERARPVPAPAPDTQTPVPAPAPSETGETQGESAP